MGDSPATSVALSFPATAEAVRRARRFVVETLDAAPECREVAGLLASELATNAVVHAGTGFSVSITRSGHVVRVRVCDHGGGVPIPRPHDPERIGGLGLAMVAAAAQRWGIDLDDPPHTAVWFELTVTDDGGARRPPARGDLAIDET